MAELALAERSTLSSWESQLELIKQTVAPGLTTEEFQLFCHVCKARGLDPLQKQIYAVKRSVYDEATGGYVKKMLIQVGVDGYRAIANRTGDYMPSDRVPLEEGVGTPHYRVTFWVKKFSARDGQWHEFPATAYYREYVQEKRDGTPVSMWQKMGYSQLTKCAETLALRRGWPEELGGLYTTEEMAHIADDGPPAQQSPLQQDRTRRELGTLKVSPSLNRGHGNEGLNISSSKLPAFRTYPAVPMTGTAVTTQITHQGQADPIPSEAYAFLDHEMGAPQPGDAEYVEPKPIPEPVKTMSRQEQFESTPGRTSKHISFKQSNLLFAVVKKLNIPIAEVHDTLEAYGIEDVALIPSNKFQEILNRLDPNELVHNNSRSNL